MFLIGLNFSEYFLSNMRRSTAIKLGVFLVLSAIFILSVKLGLDFAFQYRRFHGGQQQRTVGNPYLLGTSEPGVDTE